MSSRRLPPGRHGISREKVVGSQRTRILDGMSEAVAEKGYSNVSVADVLERAGVSRETFYEQFANKEACFLAAYEAIAAAVGETLRGVFASSPAEDGPVERLERAIDAYLEGLEGKPALTWTFLIEINSAGPTAVMNRAKAWAAVIDELGRLVGAETDEQRFACAAIFAAMVGLATQRVAAGRIEELSELRGPMREFARSALGAAGIDESGA